jgi:hypothetical protein
MANFSLSGTIPTSDGGVVALAYPPLSAVYSKPAIVPSNAKWTTALETNLTAWQNEHDTGTTGTSTGSLTSVAPLGTK